MLAKARTLAAACSGVLLACGSLLSSDPENSSPSKQCSSQMASPRVLSPGSSRVARFPSVAIRGDKEFLVGNNFPKLGGLQRISDLLTAWTLDGSNIGAPSGDFSFLYPKAGVDETGRLQLLWVEPNPRLERDEEFSFLGTSPGSIWTASYEHGAWSDPVILHTGSVVWGSSSTNDGIAARGRTLAVSSAWMFEIIYVRFDGIRWQTRRIPNPNAPGVTSVALADGVDYVAYLGATNPTPDRNSVLLVRSFDSGTTWSPPILVSKSGLNAAFELRARVTSRGILHLIWIQTLQDGGRTLRHASSSDSGATWDTPVDLALPELAVNLRVVTDACDRLVGVFEHHEDAESNHVDIAIWDQKWVLHEHLFSKRDAADAALGLNRSGEVVMALVTRDSIGDSLGPSITSLSTGAKK